MPIRTRTRIHAYLKKNDAQGIDVMELAERLGGTLLTIWMTIYIPCQAFVFEPGRKVCLRAAEFEAQHPGLCQVDLRRVWGTLPLGSALWEENDVFASEALVDLFGIRCLKHDLAQVE